MMISTTSARPICMMLRIAVGKRARERDQDRDREQRKEQQHIDDTLARIVPNVLEKRDAGSALEQVGPVRIPSLAGTMQLANQESSTISASPPADGIRRCSPAASALLPVK